MTTKKQRRKLPVGMRMYFIGIQQKYQDEKSRLFDDYDYDRISKATYDRKLKEAFDEMQATIKWAKGKQL